MKSFLLVAVLALTFAVPAGATLGDKKPEPPADNTGSLVVQNGYGFVAVNAKGGIIGRFDGGSITIEDPVEGDSKPPIVYGFERKRSVGPHTVLYSGTDVHFYVGGLYKVKIVATGMNLSAVGKGSATIGSTGFSDPGFYRVNDGPYLPIPDSPAKVTLGSS
jgi:hypothetical protein